MNMVTYNFCCQILLINDVTHLSFIFSSAKLIQTKRVSVFKWDLVFSMENVKIFANDDSSSNLNM